jgi:hypothetical protein
MLLCLLRPPRPGPSRQLGPPPPLRIGLNPPPFDVWPHTGPDPPPSFRSTTKPPFKGSSHRRRPHSFSPLSRTIAASSTLQHPLASPFYLPSTAIRPRVLTVSTSRESATADRNSSVSALHQPPPLDSASSQLPRLLNVLQVCPVSTAAHRSSPAAPNRRQAIAHPPLASIGRHGASHRPKPCPVHPPSFSHHVATGASTHHRVARRRWPPQCACATRSDPSRAAPSVGPAGLIWPLGHAS